MDLTKLTTEQRMTMVSNGMSPFNPSHVARFLKGAGLALDEKADRAKNLFGDATNLGGAGEKDVDPYALQGKDMTASQFESQVSQTQVRTQADFRSQAASEMGDYGNSNGKVFTTDDLMSLRKKPLQEQAGPITQMNTEQVKLEGFNISKQYLNAFVLNLQTPNYQNRLNLFKALQITLKNESKYTSNPAAQQAYRLGVQQAETAMLKNLQS